MKVATKRLLMVILFLLVVCGAGLSKPKEVSAKTVSKVKKVFTLTPEKVVTHKLSISKKEVVRVKIKFLKVKGKVGKVESGELMFGDWESDVGMGALFASWNKPKLKKKWFKKGKVLKTKKDNYITGESTIDWYVPKGIKKLKVRVTYYTKSGKAGIKWVK